MQAEVLLRALGEGLSDGMRYALVPDLIVDNWHQQWALMVADAAEDGEPVLNVVTRTVQAMTIARELCKTYGHE